MTLNPEVIMRQGLVFVLILVLTASSLIMAKSAFAQTIPKPAVPQFSITLYDSSYDIPASATTNPYNGQNTTSPASQYEARTLVFTIQNQAFTAFQANNGYEVKLYYNLRFKGHFDQSQDWNVLFGPNFGYIQLASGPQTVYIANGSYSSQGFDVIQWSVDFPADAQVDFQVEALIGYPISPTNFTGQESGWSNTQKVVLNQSVTTLPSTIPQTYTSPLPISSSTPTPNSTLSTTITSTPIVPEISWLTILSLFIGIFSMVVVFSRRKTAGLDK